jgi:hypothetical protein
VVDSLKALDPKRPIREATKLLRRREPTRWADFVAEVGFEGRIGRPVDFEADARPLLSDSPRGAAALTL